MAKIVGPDKLLLDQITAALRETDQFDRTFEADDIDGVKNLRALGRRAGRELGWKVRTLAVTLDTGRVRVYIVVEESTPLRDELMNIRSRKSIRNAMENMLPDGNLGPAD